MINKDIFNSSKPLENRFNEILYAFISKAVPYALPANNRTFVKDGYAGNVNIYPVVRKIVDPCIGVGWYLKDTKTDQEIEKHPLIDLLQQPNKYTKQNGFIDEAIVWRLITGERFIFWMAPETGDNKGLPAEMHLLPASEVEIMQGDWLDPVGGYKIAIGDTWKILDKNRVIHGKTTNLIYDLSGSQLRGMSPLEPALKMMSASNTGYTQLVKNFENGGPDVIITETEAGAQGVEYTKEQQQSIWETFINRFRNKSKERFLIKRKPIEIHEIGKSVVDLNIIDFLKLSLRDYCNIYNVPSALMNDNEYATQSANNREFIRALWNNAVIPQLEFFKEDLNELAYVYNKIQGTNVAFDYKLDDIPELQEDKTVLVTGLSQAWWMSPDEKREAMDQDPVGTAEMQTIYAPMGLIPLTELATPPDLNLDSQKWYDRHNTTY